MIKIKKDVKEPSILHDEIRKEILKITGKGKAFPYQLNQ